MTLATRCLVAALVFGSAGVAVSQESSRSFEVASIRPATRGVGFRQRVLPGRVEVTGTALRTLVATAFSVNWQQVTGPGWMNEAKFDIQAKMPEGTGREHVPEMLRTLLVERFGLVARVEERLVDGYELTVGEGGLKMREVEPVDEMSKDFGAARFDSVSETLDGPARAIGIPFGSRIVTSRTLYSTWTGSGGTYHIDAERMTMAELVKVLTVHRHRTVVDKTGLTGLYSFKVELDRAATLTAPVAREPTGVSTFKAIESLGLKLEERRVPLNFLVVEKIERAPSPN